MADVKEMVNGVKRFLLYRVYGDDADGLKIALQEEHEVSSSRDTDTKSTKDGGYVILGDVEQEISATTYMAVGDEMLDKLKEAQEQGKLVELWDVDVNEENKNDDGKYKATYYQTYLSEVTETAPSDDGLEVELTFNSTGGIGQRGYTALNAEQERIAQYLFTEATEAPQEEEVGAPQGGATETPEEEETGNDETSFPSGFGG